MKQPLTIIGLFCIAALVVLFASPWRADAQNAPPNATPARTAQVGKTDPLPAPDYNVPMASCVTDQCHANVKRHDQIHGPVNVNACNACHTVVDVKKHQFKLARDKDKLCTFCHEVDMGKMPVVHKPLADGDCSACHDSHGGTDRNFLKGRTMAELCNQCHDPVDNKKHVHGPVAAQACGTCHEPHESKNPKLLIRTGKDMCFYCHQEMQEQLTQTQFVHEAVKEDCTNCHNPHASDFHMMTKAEPLALCTESCHADVREAITTSPHQHTAVTDAAGCANCHTPHGGDLATLMKDKPVNICMRCHAEPIEREGGKAVMSVTEITAPDLFKHGPVAEGSCGGCHNVHGAKVESLLTKAYPAPFYSEFKVENYELCFECHDQQLVKTPKANGLTGFRNGDVNLHYLHVNKEKRGRTCRACHSTHASAHEVHIRDSVPFGNWSLPINYAGTDDGGSCAPGCHQAMGYDREQPIDYEKATAQAASQSKPRASEPASQIRLPRPPPPDQPAVPAPPVQERTQP